MKKKKSKIRIAALADLHITSRLPYTPIGDSFRKDKLIEFFHHSFKIIVEKKVDIIMVAGDILHQTAVDPDGLDLLTCFVELSRISGIPNIVVSGNHDIDRKDSILKFLKRINQDRVIFHYSPKTSEYIFADLNIRVVAIPSMSEKLFVKKAIEEGILEKDRRSESFYNILLGHQGIKGAVHGSLESFHGIEKKDIEKISKLYDLILLGHFHKFQAICENGIFIGPIQQTRIDEVSIDPGFIIIDLPDMKIVHIENKLSPRFKIIEYGSSIVGSEMEGNIVKPIIDPENNTEEENKKFISDIRICDPYYLIQPKLKKTYSLTKNYKKKESLTKEEVILKTLKNMNIREERREEIEKETLDFYRRMSDGNL